jgi:hypothetical protein
MVADATARRGGGSVVTTSLVEASGAAAVAEWVRSLVVDWPR